MRIFKSHSMLKLANSYLIDSAQASNYAWNFGFLLASASWLGVHIVLKIGITRAGCLGVNLAMLIFILLVYLHIGKVLYFGSYQKPFERGFTWVYF